MISTLKPVSQSSSLLPVPQEKEHPLPKKEDSFSVVSAKPTAVPEKSLATQLREFGLGLAATPRTIGVNVSPLPGVALGLRLEGSLHTKESALVKDNPFRMASHTVLENENPRQSIIWTQTGGVVELGIGLNGTLPLTQFFGVQFGFMPSTLLRYRAIKPHVVGFFQTKAATLAQATSTFPFSPAAAKNLTAGSEFELAGQGKSNLSGGLIGNAGTPVNSILNAGAGLSVTGSNVGTQELAVRVLALDGKDRVRVTIHRFDDEVVQGGASAYVGLRTQLTSVGQGFLLGSLATLGEQLSNSLLSYYASFNVQATRSSGNRDTIIGTFDLDLSKPEACEAYNDLMRLSSTKAENLSNIENSGVKQLKQIENELAERDEFSASLFGDKLILFEALCNERAGSFITPDGKTTLFRQANFKKHESGWFDPTRDIMWESVTLKTDDDKSAKSFFRCRYQKVGNITEPEYKDFFKLANALSLPQAESIPESSPMGAKDSDCKRIICSSMEATQTTDIYFTNDGIQKVIKADPAVAKMAFLETVAKLRKDLDITRVVLDWDRGYKLEALLEKYCAEERAGWFFNLGHFDRLSDMEEQYARLCGRCLDADARTYANAQEFAARVAQLKNPGDAREIERFFLSLGKSKGFRYQVWVATMAALAGDNETLVHQLELNGSGVVFKCLDEGKFETPSEIITSLLSKAL